MRAAPHHPSVDQTHESSFPAPQDEGGGGGLLTEVLEELLAMVPRAPQSAQSVPAWQKEYSEPGPPSSQSPSFAMLHSSVQPVYEFLLVNVLPVTWVRTSVTRSVSVRGEE